MNKNKRLRGAANRLPKINTQYSNSRHTEKEYEEALQKLSEAQSGENMERLYKNEAYAFLLSEGLLDKFLEFRTSFHRTKTQEANYLLVTQADLCGLWIDL